jgi:hypothetical protein
LSIFNILLILACLGVHNAGAGRSALIGLFHAGALAKELAKELNENLA